ncbi:MAG: hypothetical protein ACRD3O_21420, partial [Terriglobia bacterium]
MMKTAVSEKDGAWWFRWWIIAEREWIIQKGGEPWNVAGKPLAQGLEGPFSTKQEAGLAREEFVKARRQK